MNRLQRLTLNGFKSIKAMDIELRPLNILIGANGAGKSNLISFFKMLNEMMAGRFQQYIGMSGRAQSLLHFGPKITPQIEAKLEFEVENGVDSYELRLFHAAGDTLFFAEETLSFLQTGRTSPRIDHLGAGHQETKITEAAEEGKQTAKALNQYQTPELINDGQQTAPSKRIIARFPDYGKAKPVFAPQLAERIGLEVIRSRCPHFNTWLLHLESLNDS